MGRRDRKCTVLISKYTRNRLLVRLTAERFLVGPTFCGWNYALSVTGTMTHHSWTNLLDQGSLQRSTHPVTRFSGPERTKGREMTECEEKEEKQGKGRKKGKVGVKGHPHSGVYGSGCPCWRRWRCGMPALRRSVLVINNNAEADQTPGRAIPPLSRSVGRTPASCVATLCVVQQWNHSVCPASALQALNILLSVVVLPTQDDTLQHAAASARLLARDTIERGWMRAAVCCSHITRITALARPSVRLSVCLSVITYSAPNATHVVLYSTKTSRQRRPMSIPNEPRSNFPIRSLFSLPFISFFFSLSLVFFLFPPFPARQSG